MSKTKREILFEAADLIRTRGLAKGCFEVVASMWQWILPDRDCGRVGSLCVRGAIAKAAGINPETDEERKISSLVVVAINDLYPRGLPWTCAGAWNNAPERTEEEVAAVLEYAASVHA